MLKHNLLRKDFSSLAELMKVANAFVVSDSAIREPIQLSVDGGVRTQGVAQAAEVGNQGLSRRVRRENNQNNNNQQNSGKRKDEQPDAQYGSRSVVVVRDQEEQGAAGGGRKM